MPKIFWHRFTEALTEKVQHPVSTDAFRRLLTAFVLAKLLWQWPIHVEVSEIHRLRLAGGVIFGPAMSLARFADGHPHLFTLISVVFLGVHLILRSNYLTAVLFCWLCLNIWIMNIPVGDGGDFVTFLLSMWAVLLVPPRYGSAGIGGIIKTAIYNLARLGCMLQFVFLYAASGIDKLNSNVWVTGSAFSHMREAGGIINPAFPSLLSTPAWDYVFTWSTIALEIGFGLFVWIRRCQPMLIVSAIVFHLGIWWMLNLPDFGIAMIVAVLIFVRDDQYLKMFRPWLLST